MGCNPSELLDLLLELKYRHSFLAITVSGIDLLQRDQPNDLRNVNHLFVYKQYDPQGIGYHPRLP